MVCVAQTWLAGKFKAVCVGHPCEQLLPAVLAPGKEDWWISATAWLQSQISKQQA